MFFIIQTSNCQPRFINCYSFRIYGDLCAKSLLLQVSFVPPWIWRFPSENSRSRGKLKLRSGSGFVARRVFFFFDGVEVRGEWLLGLCNPIISILNKSNSTSPPRSESDKNDKVLGKFKFFFKKQVIETFKIATIIFKH